jgi:HSP20 family protein
MAHKDSEALGQQRRFLPWRPFNQLLEGGWWPGSSDEPREPKLDLDLYEDNNDEIVVKAELPGMSGDDIRVSIIDNILTIRGEKKKEEEESGKDYYRSERMFGVITRAVKLPGEVNPEQVRAVFKDGVLEVRLPRNPEAKKKQIEVKVGD